VGWGVLVGALLLGGCAGLPTIDLDVEAEVERTFCLTTTTKITKRGVVIVEQAPVAVHAPRRTK
jgi:hypothetical protein